MKYEKWLEQELNMADLQNFPPMVSVPIHSLESLLENIEGLERYVKYLTNNNEYLSNAMRYYRNLADQPKNKGEDSGS